MKKIFFFILFFLLIKNLFYSLSIEEVIKLSDQLSDNGNNKESLQLLLENFDKSNPDIRLMWRIARDCFIVSESFDKSKDKYKYFDIAIDIAGPYIDKEFPNKRDKAELIHWYAINYSTKMKLLGIFAGREALSLIPNTFKLQEKCIQTDPTFSGSYFFLGKFYSEIPGFLGGDQIKMMQNFYKALSLAEPKEILTYKYETSYALIKRNWSVETKQKNLSSKKLKTDGTPENMSDIEYAKELLNSIINDYQKLEKPLIMDKQAYEKAKALLKKIESN